MDARTVDIVRLCCGYLIRTDHSCRTDVICPESADLGKSIRRSEYDQLGSRAAIQRDVADLVDVSLHPTRETCLADWTTARGMLIAGTTSQTLSYDM